MAIRLPRTIRLDPSDTFVYLRAAEPGEWAVTGTFLFFGVDVDKLAGKERQAFRAGFLGIDSFGWSTLVVVTEASAQERAAAVERLSEQLVAHCGAPDMERARAAAEEEITFAQSLCDHPPNTLLGIHRASEGESFRESFRTLHRSARQLEPANAFRFVEVEEEEPSAEEVDLFAMARERK
jgi:phenylpyruvate tautomerase PptA (4-oxalocrotonate tautomerase family)